MQQGRQLLDAVDQPGARPGPGGVGVDRVHGYAGGEPARSDELLGESGGTGQAIPARGGDDDLGVGRVDLLPRHAA
jgi:hypothetical protein